MRDGTRYGTWFGGEFLQSALPYIVVKVTAGRVESWTEHRKYSAAAKEARRSKGLLCSFDGIRGRWEAVKDKA